MLFMTDGIVVSEGLHSPKTLHRASEALWMNKCPLSVLSGNVRWLRLYLRRVGTYIAAPQDSRLPGQYILGSNNCWTSAVHSSLVPLQTRETAHVQPGKISPRRHAAQERGNTGRSLINALLCACLVSGWRHSYRLDAAHFLHQHNLLVRRDMFMRAVPQQHIPLHARLHRRHPRLSRCRGHKETDHRCLAVTAPDLQSAFFVQDVPHRSW